MIIKPVYLVEPEPDRRVKMSRRAFVLAGAGLFVGGAGAGALGSAALARDEPTDRNRKMLEHSQALAVGKVEDLYGQSYLFVTTCQQWPTDVVLRFGLKRLARYLVENTELHDRMKRARGLAALKPVLTHNDNELRALLEKVERISGQ